MLFSVSTRFRILFSRVPNAPPHLGMFQFGQSFLIELNPLLPVVVGHRQSLPSTRNYRMCTQRTLSGVGRQPSDRRETTIIFCPSRWLTRKQSTNRSRIARVERS